MACPCDTGVNIRTCGPFANRDDVMEIIAMTCKDCVATVPLGTDPTDFCTLGFGGAMDDCCEMQFVFEGTENIWYSTDCTNWVLPGCNDCVYTIDPITYPDKTTWCAVADADGHSTDCCKPMFFSDGTDIWLTEDCASFENMTTRTPLSLDVKTYTVSAAAIGMAFDGNWYNYPGSPYVSVTMQSSGYLMGEIQISVLSDTGLVQTRLNNLTTGNPFTCGIRGGNATSNNAPSAYCYQYVPAGTYLIYAQYRITPGTTATDQGCGFRVWTYHED